MLGGITAEGAMMMVVRRGLDETSWGRLRAQLNPLLPRVEKARQLMLALIEKGKKA
jgi:hypothetical protein